MGDGLLPEPFISGFDQAGAMLLDIINIVQLASKRIQDIDDDDFPISLALVQKSHDTENLDLLDLADESNTLANFADVKWIVIAQRIGLGMFLGRIFPCLSTHA